MLALEPREIIALDNGIVLHSLPDQDFYHAFSVVTGDQFRLNKTSFWVLERIGTGIEWGKLRASFIQAFEIPLENGLRDLRELIDSLYTQRIVRRESNEKEEI